MKNQTQLVEKYPQFFKYLKDHKGPIIPIQFGFECGDGWYWLISNLMDTIHRYCKDNDKPHPNITQIKEKYGGLRFYHDGGNELIDGMVWLAEHLSYEICEDCGTTENVTTNKLPAWVYTLCDTCRKKQNKRKITLSYLKWRIKNIDLLLISLNKKVISAIKLWLVFLRKSF